jgi:hypothetical protein
VFRDDRGLLIGKAIEKWEVHFHDRGLKARALRCSLLNLLRLSSRPERLEPHDPIGICGAKWRDPETVFPTHAATENSLVGVSLSLAQHFTQVAL